MEICRKYIFSIYGEFNIYSLQIKKSTIMKKSLLFIVLALLTLNVLAQIPTNGLVAYYSFNGNASENSGNNYVATVNGATLTTNRFNIANSAYYLNGQSDYISTQYQGILGNQSRSICIWAKLATINSENPLVMYGSSTSVDGGTDRYLCQVMSNPSKGASIDNDGSRIIMQSAVDTAWHFYVWTYDVNDGASISSVKMYVDGVLLVNKLENYIPFPAAGQINTKADVNVTFGKAINTYFNGKLDDIRIYNTAITANDVSALYNESTSCLVAHYPFTGNASDASGNGNDATVSQATLTTDRFGAANSAYSFNGTSSYINSTFPAISNNSTITFWFYTNALYSNGPNFLETSSGYCEINLNNGTLDYVQNLSAGNAYVNSGALNPATLGNWHFVAIKYATDSLSIFVDGVKKNVTKTTGTLTPISSLLLGKRPNNTGYFNGKLDDIKVYGCGLSAADISSLFNESICKQSISVTDTLIINMNITGYNPISYSNAIKIYPNPANDQLNVSIANANNNGYQIKIVNTLSQVMWSQTISGSSYSMSLSGFSAGTYFVNVYDGQSNLVEVKKLILQ